MFILGFIFNLLIFIGEIIGFAFAAHEFGWSLFCYYTELSNLFLLISSGAYLVSFFFNVVKGCGTNYPTHLLRLMATSTTTMTFLVVLFVLIPMQVLPPLALLFKGSMLFHHTLCPILGILSFLLFEKQESRNLKLSHLPYALVFTLIYGIIFIFLNSFKVYDGPYPFLRVYNQPIWASILWFIVLIGLAYLISFLLYLGNTKIFKRGIIHG